MRLALLLAALPLAFVPDPHPSTAPAGSAAPPQSPNGNQQESASPTKYDLVSLADISLTRFRPENVDAGELTELARRLIGREIYVVENGGYDSAPVANIQLLGSSLVIYDVPQHAARTLKTLRELDQVVQQGAQDSAPSQVQTWEYTPRYLSLEAAYHAVGTLQREYEGHMNLSLTEERRLLVVRDDAERVAEFRELLERVDVPEDQVTISCWLLQGASGGNAAPSGASPARGSIPAELAEHLARLVPGQSFQPFGYGMLQVSSATDREVSLQLGAGGPQMYQLELRPTAYDRQTGSLTVASCSLRALNRGDFPQLFTTSAVLRGGSYTVIGASGAEPILVAVLVRPVGK
jgi:hypothetical protein